MNESIRSCFIFIGLFLSRVGGSQRRTKAAANFANSLCYLCVASIHLPTESTISHLLILLR